MLALAVGVVVGADQQAGGGELLPDVAGDGGQVAAVKGDEYRQAGGGVQAGGGGPTFGYQDDLPISGRNSFRLQYAPASGLAAGNL